MPRSGTLADGGIPAVAWSHLTVSFITCGRATAGLSRNCCAWSKTPKTGLNGGEHARESCAREIAESPRGART
jgi:hypothetical protein